jgi:hypothetical protein
MLLNFLRAASLQLHWNSNSSGAYHVFFLLWPLVPTSEY